MDCLVTPWPLTCYVTETASLQDVKKKKHKKQLRAGHQSLRGCSACTDDNKISHLRFEQY